MMSPDGMGYVCKVVRACDLGDPGLQVTLAGTVRDFYLGRGLVEEVPAPTVAEKLGLKRKAKAD